MALQREQELLSPSESEGSEWLNFIIVGNSAKTLWFMHASERASGWPITGERAVPKAGAGGGGGSAAKSEGETQTRSPTRTHKQTVFLLLMEED